MCATTSTSLPSWLLAQAASWARASQRRTVGWHFFSERSWEAGGFRSFQGFVLEKSLVLVWCSSRPSFSLTPNEATPCLQFSKACLGVVLYIRNLTMQLFECCLYSFFAKATTKTYKLYIYNYYITIYDIYIYTYTCTYVMHALSELALQRRRWRTWTNMWDPKHLFAGCRCVSKAGISLNF